MVPPPRTVHTDPFRAPECGPLESPAYWCRLCRCWDRGLVVAADGIGYLHPDHPGAMTPRTSHTNRFNAPDFVLSDEPARWCCKCRCWDLGLVETADGSGYTHPDHPGAAA